MFARLVIILKFSFLVAAFPPIELNSLCRPYLGIYNQKKKTQHFQNRFSHIHFYQNTPNYIYMYQIKHNWMNFMMVKTVCKNILQ